MHAAQRTAPRAARQALLHESRHYPRGFELVDAERARKESALVAMRFEANDESAGDRSRLEDHRDVLTTPRNCASVSSTRSAPSRHARYHAAVASIALAASYFGHQPNFSRAAPASSARYCASGGARAE